MSFPEDQRSVSQDPDSQEGDDAQRQGNRTMEDKEEKTDITSLSKDLASEREKNRELFEKYIRLQAEFENFKKRMEREKCEFFKYSQERLIKDILPVLDHLELAIKSANESKDIDSFTEGVRLIHKQLHDTLAKEGLTYVCSVGEKFDPCRHEAVMHIESYHHKPDVVMEELKKGYFLNDRLIRPTMVKVAKKPQGKKGKDISDEINDKDKNENQE
ncbi:nucleotide exchange factor GrpE [bacterium]|nr:nucleotide exchange factor GrpE [bacterium]